MSRDLFYYATLIGLAFCLFKVNSGNARTMCEICSMLTIKTPDRRCYLEQVNTEQNKNYMQSII